MISCELHISIICSLKVSYRITGYRSQMTILEVKFSVLIMNRDWQCGNSILQEFISLDFILILNLLADFECDRMMTLIWGLFILQFFNVLIRSHQRLHSLKVLLRCKVEGQFHGYDTIVVLLIHIVNSSQAVICESFKPESSPV